jgi:hypothetical protein
MGARYVQTQSAIATAAAATKTIIQLVTAATAQLYVVEFGVSFDGATATAPVRVDMLRQTTAGTSVAGTPVKWSPDDPTTPLTATLITFTAEPTASDVLSSWYIPANNGLFVIQYPLGREPKVAVSTRIGWRVVTPAGVNPNCTMYAVWEE